MKPLNLSAGIGCLLGGAAMLVWVLRQDRQARSSEIPSKWSRGFLSNLLFGSVGLMVLGIVMLVGGVRP
jgi:hypothetical protein